MEGNIIRKIRCYWIVLPVFLVFALGIINYRDIYMVSLAILGISFWAGWKDRNIHINLLDVVIIIFWLYEGVQILFSINQLVTFSYFKVSTLVITYYFILRVVFSRGRMDLFLYWSSLFVSLLAILGLVAFTSFKERFYGGGFTSLYDFRAFFLPLGRLTNVWSNLLLGFWGIIALAFIRNQHSKQFSLLLFAYLSVLYSLIVSFSRGVYIASIFIFTGLCIVFLLTKHINRQRKIITILFTLSLFLLAEYQYKDEIHQTFGMNKSVSQQRSTKGRLDMGNMARLIVKENPLSGIGSGNFSLAANVYSYENNPYAYTGNASSIFFQLPVEKGFIGTALFLIIFLLSLVAIVKTKRRRVESIVSFIFISGLMIRELTFPVLLDDEGLQMITFTWLAIIQNNGQSTLHNSFYKDNIKKMIRILPLIIWIIFFPFNLFEAKDLKNNTECLSLVDDNNLSMAFESIKTTSETTPYLINKAILAHKSYIETKDANFLTIAEKNLVEARKKNPRDFQIVHHLALIFKQKNKLADAYTLLRGLTDRFPENPQFNISMYQLLIDQEKKEDAAPYLVKAVFIMPGLLDTNLWNEVVKDSFLMEIIEPVILEKLYDTGTNDPLQMAKRGRLLIEWGDTIHAKAYLEEVVTVMPNLSRPWAFLGMIYYEEGNRNKGRECLLASLTIDPWDRKSNAYWSYYEGEERIVPFSNNTFDELYAIYYAKYRKWYHTIPLSFNDFMALSFQEEI